MSGPTLVTGATGHLGANLVRRLLEDGSAVRVLLKPGERTDAIDGLDVERIVGDLRAEEAVARAVRGAERVYHTGALVSTVPGSTSHDVARRAGRSLPAFTTRLVRAADDFDAVRYLGEPESAAVPGDRPLGVGGDFKKFRLTCG